MESSECFSTFPLMRCLAWKPWSNFSLSPYIICPSLNVSGPCLMNWFEKQKPPCLTTLASSFVSPRRRKKACNFWNCFVTANSQESFATVTPLLPFTENWSKNLVVLSFIFRMKDYHSLKLSKQNRARLQLTSLTWRIAHLMASQKPSVALYPSLFVKLSCEILTET